MTILWHSVKYPPKKDGDYYYAKFYSDGNRKIRYIDTTSYSVQYGWCAYERDDGEIRSEWPMSESDQWAEVEYVESDD